MIFNSAAFLIFFPIVITGYFLLPTKYRWLFLLIASYYFYMSWKVDLIYLILITTAISYSSALIIERTDKIKMKKFFLILTLVSSLGILFLFKYFNFLSLAVFQCLNHFGMSIPAVTFNLILPVGISFYTFQTLSYVIDVYHGKIKAERHFGYYALFVSYFPQLVAGPIERPENLLPQLRAIHTPSAGNFSEGLRIAVKGFYKKIAVADLSARFVNEIFNDPGKATGSNIIFAALLFAVQIYCDFSGYTDIATGCARMMGINLTKNFDRPYSARTIKEFWARWHISLSSWFRDYLYIPLGGNRVSTPRYLTNIFIVFLISGLWHGADWTFIIWGSLHAFYQIIGYLTRNIRSGIYSRMKLDKDSKPAVIWQTAFTFGSVCFAWIFFRANNVSELGILLNHLVFSWDPTHILDSISSVGYGTTQLCITALSLYIMIVLDRDQSVLSRGNGGKSYALSVWVIAFAWLILLAGNGISSFIYFQF